MMNLLLCVAVQMSAAVQWLLVQDEEAQRINTTIPESPRAFGSVTSTSAKDNVRMYDDVTQLLPPLANLVVG